MLEVETILHLRLIRELKQPECESEMFNVGIGAPAYNPINREGLSAKVYDVVHSVAENIKEITLPY